MKYKQHLGMVFMALAAGFLGSWGHYQWFSSEKDLSSPPSLLIQQPISDGLAGNVSFLREYGTMEVPSFVEASNTATQAVVFIKTISEVRQSSPFWFFDNDPFGSIGQVSSTGSGVIMSSDGYIVTNLHVIKNAVKIEVVLNNRKKVFPAELVGADPSTDLALLKIDAKGLQAIKAGNSEVLKIGEWVLAVGNPFNLTSTVTAGIVSAKGRNINIVNNQFPIESFIQTDAAINPGNSGGALVNTKGELVGINTAIISKTGAYSGYGFAIPVNMVVKIVNDLVEFGEVQRGFTGMDVADIDFENQKALNISYDQGVYVANVLEDGPAFKAGIRAGDLVTGFQGRETESKSVYDELLSYQRPGDKVKITYQRDGKSKEATITLINKEGNTELVRKTYVRSEELGANFSKLSKVEMQKYAIEHGIKVTEVRGNMLRRMGIHDDFIFISFNGKPCKDPHELIKMLSQPAGRIQIEGITPDGRKKFYSFYGY
jgi:Do/DeqQ family serine protease